MTEVQLAEAKVARAEKVKRVLIVATTVLVLACLLLTLKVSSQVRDTQLEGTPVGKRLLESSERILDCTEAGSETQPPGECYQRNRESTAEVLASVQRIIILSAACAVEVDPTKPVGDRIAAITTCVNERLAASTP